MSVWEILSQYHRQLFVGLRMTLLLCFATYSIGFLLGVLLGCARYRFGRWLDVPCRFISIILSALPLLVLLFWLHYPLQYMLHVVINPVYTAIVALSLIMTFMVADVVCDAFQNFPEDLVDAARVSGLSRHQMAQMIQWPIIFRQVLPHFLFIMVVILQGTLFTSLISVHELFRAAQEINSEIYKPVPIYTALALFFIFICSSLNLLGIYLRLRFKWKTSG